MTEIAMDQRRDQDTEEVVGIAWGDPEPAERESGEPLNDLDDPKYCDKERGNCYSIADTVPYYLKVQIKSSVFRLCKKASYGIKIKGSRKKSPENPQYSLAI